MMAVIVKNTPGMIRKSVLSLLLSLIISGPFFDELKLFAMELA
jgi:hypothetical protein